MKLTDQQKKTLLLLARRTIADTLKIDHSIPEQDLSDEIFSQKCGVFVTLHKSGNLRGCIGYIVGYNELEKAVPEMARSAAFRDPRFSSLKNDEFVKIDIEISVLSPLEDVTDVSEIVTGRDGLVISRDGYQGLLLPQVASEQGWEREEFLAHTCFKAGLPPDAWRKPGTRIQKFSAEVFGEKEFGLI